MIADELLVRGIEVASLVFVVFAIGRNALFSRLGRRERDPMRMTPRDLHVYLLEERAGYGKHVLRDIKLTRLSGPLIELRTQLFRQNRPDLWLVTFDQTMHALRTIIERVDLYDQTVHGMRKSDRRAIRRAIRADAAALVKRVREMLRASSRPLTQDVKSKLLGVAAKNDGVLLAEPMRSRIAEITRSVEAALAGLPPDDATSEAAFTLRETINRYLPDTLAAYFKLAAIDKAAAQAELEPQIRIIEESTRSSVAALREGRLTELSANGIFLRDRLAAGQAVPPQPAHQIPSADRDDERPDRTRLDQLVFFVGLLIGRKAKTASRD
jgi:hypothetical protein